MSTSIFTIKKLEKLIQKYITPKSNTEEDGILGKWNATVFYTHGRKNWLLYNPKTHYSVILENLTAKDLPNIKQLIAEEFHLQLTVDGIDSTQKQVNWLLEDISFHSSDGDRSATAHINQLLYIIDFHQHSEYYKSLAEINFNLNDRIFSLDGTSKYTSLTKPKEEMEKILKEYFGSVEDKSTPPKSVD